MHINVKPRDAAQTYITDADAIQHLWIYACYAKAWQDVHFGRDMRDMRRVDDAIKSKDATAFRASRRKGYWRIELAKGA